MFDNVIFYNGLGVVTDCYEDSYFARTENAESAEEFRRIVEEYEREIDPAGIFAEIQFDRIYDEIVIWWFDEENYIWVECPAERIPAQIRE